jgi:hypothetical protein
MAVASRSSLAAMSQQATRCQAAKDVRKRNERSDVN